MAQFSRPQQRLGRDTAPIEANAAKVFAFHNTGLHAKLGRANSRHIATRAAANHDDIKLGFGHYKIPPTGNVLKWRLSFKQAMRPKEAWSPDFRQSP